MRYIIFANGNIPSNDIYLPQPSTLIAADGGAKHCLSLGFSPQVVIGDFDSLTREELVTLESTGAALIKHETSKNETDLELALDFAVENGATEIILFGLLGGRWDMSISNIMLLTTPRFEHVNFYILNGTDELYILRGGKELCFQGNPGDHVSVIPLTPLATGISYQGLNWPLQNESLEFGAQRGLSNHMIDDEARIVLDCGVLLVIIQRNLISKFGFENSKYKPA